MGHDFCAYGATAREPIPDDKRPQPARPLPQPEQSLRLRELLRVPEGERAGIVALLVYMGKARSTASGGLELLGDAEYPPGFAEWRDALYEEREEELIALTDTEVVLRLADREGDAPVTTFGFSCGYGTCDDVMAHVRRFGGDGSLRFPPDELRERAWAQRVLSAMCAAASSFCAAKGLAGGVPEGEATAWFRLPEWSAPDGQEAEDGWHLEVYHGLGRLCLVACMTPTGVINCF